MVSVERDGKIIALHWSKDLVDFATLKALYKGCEVTAHEMLVFKTANKKH